MDEWRPDKEWSDAFLPEIKHVLGVHLIGEAPVEDDQQRNTDLIVLKMDAVRIGCRVRRPKYLDRYADEFTIRAGRPSGAKTELTKIVEGWGDYLFYGIAAPDEADLACWLLGDLKAFRLWFNRRLAEGHRPWQCQQNHDGSSDFLAFKIADLGPDFIVAQKIA